MGYKKVCFDCRKAFSVFGEDTSNINLVCPECGRQATLFNHKFRPPKKNNVKQWELVKFLKDNGFVYQHVYKKIGDDVLQQIAYPETMEDAKLFVEKYKSLANTNWNVF